MDAGDSHSTHDDAPTDAPTRDPIPAGRAAASGADATATATAHAHATWYAANAHGLDLAASGAWNAARTAFDAALSALASESAPGVGTHEATALILGNLAQACLRDGNIDDAIRHAQRGCALRVALVGEDAVTVARARSDLAVILAAAGRIEESPALLARAIAGIEQSAGDEDLRLALVLENAARTALAAGQAANAEPHLIRLHALLGAHDLSTEPADRLVSRIMAARSDAETASRTAVSTPVAVVAVPDVQVSPSVIAPLSAPVSTPTPREEIAQPVPAQETQAASEQVTATLPQDAADWDDQPLRDAVALTDVLLRTTPSGNVAVRAEPDARDPWTATPADVDAPLDLVELDVSGIDLVDDHALDRRDRHGEHAAVDATTDTAEVTAQDAAQDAAGDTAADAVIGAPIDAPAPSGLGFVVEYGIPRDTASQPAIPDRSVEPPGIRGGDAMARETLDSWSEFDPDGDENVDLLTPPSASMSLGFGAEFELLPDTQGAPAPHATPTSVDPVVPPVVDATRAPGQVERRKTPRAVAVVMPSPAGGAPIMQSTMTDRDDSDRPSSCGAPAPGAAQAGQARRAPQRVGTRLTKEPTGSGRAFAIGGTVVALAAAAVGWFFLRGNF